MIIYQINIIKVDYDNKDVVFIVRILLVMAINMGFSSALSIFRLKTLESTTLPMLCLSKGRGSEPSVYVHTQCGVHSRGWVFCVCLCGHLSLEVVSL